MLILPTAAEIKLSLRKSVSEIMNYSRQVMTTVGEWELLDITAEKLIQTDDTQYPDLLIFNVSGWLWT